MVKSRRKRPSKIVREKGKRIKVEREIGGELRILSFTRTGDGNDKKIDHTVSWCRKKGNGKDIVGHEGRRESGGWPQRGPYP